MEKHSNNRFIPFICVTVVFVIVAAMAICFPFIWKSGESANAEILSDAELLGEQTQSDASATYKMGEWVELNNKAEVERLKSENPQEYEEECYDDYPYPFGDWDGALRVRIDKVELFDSPMAAGFTKKDIYLPSYLPTWGEEGEQFCLITYTVQNVDAKPGVRKSGKRGFLNDLKHIVGMTYYDEIYFDGMIENGDLEKGDGNVFYLAPGETRTFQSGIVVEGDGLPSAIIVGHFWKGFEVSVNCEDKRENLVAFTRNDQRGMAGKTPALSKEK